MSVKVSCPGCGGPIIFKVGSAIVAVCPYCRSVVARGDRQLENLGKVADLVETDSVLAVGFKGRYHGIPFELTGRTQLGHQAGGVWDEWYAAFADGRWGWLAEAQGRFYLTFEHAARPGSIPPFRELRLGERLDVAAGSAPLTVAEKGEARAVSAEGEIPFRLEPGQTYRYADLSGPGAEFATLDYGETPPLLFIGHEVTLDDLGLPATARPVEREARQIEGLQLSCPQCGGALELRAPDKTERVTCPNCGALLDVNQGQLSFLKALEPGGVKPILPLGSRGQLSEGQFITIGFMKRSVTLEGVRYPWEEYLLYHARLGFRWLVRSDNHWNYVVPVPPGRVHATGRAAELEGRQFKLFQRATARVDHVLGEFYWKVTVDEEALAADYIRPPEMLSREVTRQNDEDQKGEINWSLATYVPTADVEKAFGVQGLPRPDLGNVAPNQPFPYSRIYPYWALFVAVLLVLGLIVLAASPRRKVYEKTITPQPFSGPEQSKAVFSEPFELRAHQNVRVTVRSSITNTWLHVDGDLFNEETGFLENFAVPLEHYHGVSEGESWSEGSQEGTAHLSSLPAGRYTLRLDFHGEPGKNPGPVTVQVEQGVPRLLLWFLALLGVSLVPLAVAAYHIYFESRRWQGSSIKSD